MPTHAIGLDAFQECDTVGITRPCTKHNYLVRDADDLPRVLAEAFHIARTGRPGPVHVDITEDALQHAADRVIDAARSAAALLKGREAALVPGHYCSWCPRAAVCPAAELAPVGVPCASLFP